MKPLKINWFIVVAAGLMAVAMVKEFRAQIAVDPAQVAAQEAALTRITPNALEGMLANDAAPRQFLFVYASWCGACHQVMPYALQALQGKTGVSAYFISLDQDTHKLATYLASLPLQGQFTPYLVPPSEADALKAMLNAQGAAYTGAIPFLAIFKHGKPEIDSTASGIEAVIGSL